MKKVLIILLCAFVGLQVMGQSRPSPSSKSAAAKTAKENQQPRKTYAERVADSIAGQYGPDNVLITNVVTVESSVQNVTATDITIEQTVITNVLIENVICKFLTLTNATISDLKIKKGNEEAVFLWRHVDGSYSIDVYLILASDIKITEILRSTQKTIKYSIEKKFGISVRQLNVFAESIASNN